MTVPHISAVIMTRNEAGNIEDAIKSLRFADQIVVADTGSSDETMELARRAGAEVHCINFDGFGPSKNRALGFSKGEWVFFLDADERVSPELAESIKKSANNNRGFVGFETGFLTYFLGKPIRHSGWYPEFHIRFFKKNRSRFSNRLVHEGVEVDGKIGRLDGLIYHYSYDNLHQYHEKMNTYSTLNAEEMYTRGKKCRIIDILFRPPAILLKMYILKAGFLDGYRGFLLAALSSYHVFVKYVKLRQLYKGGKR